MNCTDLFHHIGFKCQALPQEDSSQVFYISTPFQTFDGDGVKLFAEQVESNIRFFDAGHTIFHMLGSGLRFDTQRALAPIKKLVSAAGADLSDDGEISALASIEKAHEASRRALTAIIAASAWEAENAGLSDSTVTLAVEVEFFLKQWKPYAPLVRAPKIHGISGREYEFDFLFEDTLVDVVSSRPQSTAAKIRKLADVTGIPSQYEKPMLIIIDDRRNPQQAKQEAAILRQFAPTKTISWLEKQSPNDNIMHS